MNFVLIILVLLATGLVITVALINDDDLALLRALGGIFIFFLGVAVCVIGESVANEPSNKKEQPKYKQEIVYSLKDGKYLPTDTLYIEIK